MAKHGIPTVDLHHAIVGQCGAPPQGACFGAPKCFCPHCAGGGGVGYEWIAAHTIVPALTKLLPAPRAGATARPL